MAEVRQVNVTVILHDDLKLLLRPALGTAPLSIKNVINSLEEGNSNY